MDDILIMNLASLGCMYILRVFHTVKPLKFRQVFYRVKYALFSLSQLETKCLDVTSCDWLWSGKEFNEPSFLSNNKVFFLNLKADIASPKSWNNSAFEKLWLYNLHYFDDLNAIGSASRKETHFNLMKRWIEENPAVKGNGWEPYPLSLRLVNWVKWYQRAEIDDSFIIESIALQAQALSKQLEYHILGNHLFANAKALVFVGCFLEGELGSKYLKLGLKLLDREIPEQFLGDGGHFELSPMYHSILVWDLLDLINLSQISKENFLLSRLSSWRSYAIKALAWLEVMTHNDGEVSFFNDATIGIAASPIELKNYAESLGLMTVDNNNRYVLLKDSGYTRIQNAGYSLWFDHGEVGPSYLPGHAHADTLSFELSVGSDRFFVNSGTSLYGLSEERHRQRGTAAHNTVIVNETDSSEVWGGFRVARRAHVSDYNAVLTDDTVTISAKHDGYSRLKGVGFHARKITASQNSIYIKDTLTDGYTSAYSVIHVHPDIKVNVLSDTCIELVSRTGNLITFTSPMPVKLEPSSYHPAFGISVPNKKLVIPVHNGSLEVLIEIKKGFKS